MIFALAPIIDTMLDLYQKPRSMERFNEYLKILQGDTKDDMVVPVGNFNPMAKEHVIEKLQQLRQLKAEDLIASVLEELNKKSTAKSERIIKTSLALADDLKGAWTNKFTTDYDSKFKLNALLTRNFCTPLFWTSEEYSEALIRERTLQYCLRTLYAALKPKPKTLEEHVLQEIFVSQNSEINEDPNCHFEELKDYFEIHKKSDAYNIIFNFMYGDKACNELMFPAYGINDDYAGYLFARRMAFLK